MTSVNDIKTALERLGSPPDGLQWASFSLLLHYPAEIADLRAYAEQRDKRVAELEAQLSNISKKTHEYSMMLEPIGASAKPATQVSQPVGAVVAMTDEEIRVLAAKFLDDGQGFWKRPVIEEIIAYTRAALVAQTAAPEVNLHKQFDTSLNRRKLADLVQRGHAVIGHIMYKDGQYALFDGSCRWLTQPQYQRLMHEQDGSLFAAPAAPLDISGLTRYGDNEWAATADPEFGPRADGEYFKVADVRALNDAQKGK